MWFEKKKYPILRFLSFRFCPILEIENLEIRKVLVYFNFLSSWERLKLFIELQINSTHALMSHIK